MRKYLIIILIVVSFGFRINRPQTFSLEWDQDQINQLNDYLEDVFELQKGEFNLDIETTTKTNADNGDFWFIQTGSTIRMQYKANDHIFTITPDGF